MRTDDPISDEILYTLERERKEQEWLESRNLRCAECDELIGSEEYIDLSARFNEEGYTFHKNCMTAWFEDPKPGAICDALEAVVFDEYRRNG